jgi:hypothetical protein
MSMDSKPIPIVPPCLGCHSTLDKYKGEMPDCEYMYRHEDGACNDCNRPDAEVKTPGVIHEV